MSLSYPTDSCNLTPTIVMSNRFEILREALFSEIVKKRVNRPRRTLILTPSNRIKEFILQEGIKRWGVFHAVQFSNIPDGFSLLFALANRGETSFISTARLSLYIEEILQKESLFTSYIQGDSKKIAPLARALAKGFSRWGWEGGPLKEEGSLLLKKLEKKIDFPTLLTEKLSTPKIAYEVHIFGAAKIPKAVEPLLKLFPTWIYFLSPTPNYWGDLLSDGAIAKLDERFQKNKISLNERETFEELASDSNPELSNLSMYARPLFTKLLEAPFFEEYEEIKEESTLTILQNDIYHLTKREELASDSSIDCVEAICPLLEVEELHRNIRKWLTHDKIEPKDIIVLLPNLSLYTPHIELVFGGSSPFGFAILEASGAQQNSPLYALKRLFSLLEDRFSKEAVLAFVTSPYFAKGRFNLTTSDYRLFYLLVEEYKVEWGYDLKMRRALLKEEKISDRGTWQRTFQTILETIGKHTSPFTLDELDSLGKWISLIEGLYQALVELEKPMTLYEMQKKITLLIATYFTEEEELLLFCKKVKELVYKTDTLFSFASVKALLSEGVYNALSPSLKPRITFCELSEGAALPHPIVCLLGMDEESFPRKVASCHIVRKIFKEEESRHKDKFIFLQALLAPTKKLYISYSCLDPEGKPLSYSLLLTPLFLRMKDFKVRKSVPELAPPPLKTFDILEAKEEEPLPITVDDLIKMARHPIQYYGEKVLGLFLQDKKEGNEFTLSAIDKALLARESLQGKSVDLILQEALEKNRLPTALFYETAKRELIEEIKTLEGGLLSFDLEPKDLYAVHFSKKEKMPFIGKIDSVTKEGLFVPKNYTLGEVWRHLPHLFLLAMAKEKTSLLFKDGTKKSFTVVDPANSLSLFLDYFKAAKKEISPLLPDWTALLLKGDKERFLTAVNTPPFFKDPYLEILKPNLTYPWEKHAEDLWQSLTH
jgi:exonuclease V gamma subunit